MRFMDRTPEPEAAGSHVFVSYSRQDAATVTRVTDALEQAGHAVFRDLTSIKGGDDWIETLERGLRQAYAVVLVISEYSLSSKWVRDETLLALQLRKRIVPISLTPGQVPFEVLHINVIDASTDLASGIELLLASLPQPPSVPGSIEATAPF